MERAPSRFHVEPVESGSQNELSSQNFVEQPPDKDFLSVCVIDTNDGSVNSNAYDSRTVRSLRHYTHEALPRLDHYRNIHSLHAHYPRPTLDELHNGDITISEDQVKFILFIKFSYIYF